MISLSFAPRESFCTAIASSSPRNASISVFISAPVVVPFGAPFIPASVPVIAPFAPASAPVSSSFASGGIVVPLPGKTSVSDSSLSFFTSAFDGEAFDGEAFNRDSFNNVSFDDVSFSAVSAVSSAPVSSSIRCSEPAANTCGCHPHVFHINIAANTAAKIFFGFFLILFSSHFCPDSVLFTRCANSGFRTNIRFPQYLHFSHNILY